MISKFRLTPRAVKDLKSIGNYTLRPWGRDQRDNHLKGLYRHFEILANQPLLSRSRSDVSPDYRSIPHKAHLIFYIVRDGGIDIIGVPHQAMDLPGHFASIQRDQPE